MKILEVLTERRRIGNIGERRAKGYLKWHGYKIREVNYVALGNEIDIIAEDKLHIVFCEVKTRTLGKIGVWAPRPASAVTTEKRDAIIKVAKYYLAYMRIQKRVRFDVIEVYVDEKNKVRDLKHLINAFDADTARKKQFKQ